jgi:glycosyltransferase involved in cell wall biosynthesis
MRIAIDATSIPRKPAGAGVYAIELVRALAGREDRRDGYAVFTRGPWFDQIVASLPNWRIERVSNESRLRRLAWEQFELPGLLNQFGIDVLHSTHHSLPLRSAGVRRVVTIHDVTFFRIPQRYPPVRRFYMQATTRLASRVADGIIVPSQAVRNDVARVLHVGEEKLHVVYEAPGPQYAPMHREGASAVARRYGLDLPYILSVGSLEPGKNRARLIRALHELRGEGVAHQLAVVGQPAWKHEHEASLVEQLGMERQVRFLGYVPEEDMPALYNAASIFAFPSLYEGFGLPVIEAMACGVPVLTSNVSATAEVAGDAALLVDPRSTAEIRDGLARLIADADLRETLARRGLARAEEFSWRRAAEETHAVYEQVATKAAER